MKPMPSIAAVSGAGLRAAWSNARLLGWALAGNLVLALLAVFPLMRPFVDSLARDEAAERRARVFDMSWWVDLTTAQADSFARALDGIAAAAFVSAILGCFLAGGMLQAHRDALARLPMDRFMTCCRRWFLTFLRLFLLTLPLYWLAHRVVNHHLTPAVEALLEWADDERLGLAIQLTRAGFFLLLFDLVTLSGDYARVHAVVRSERSMILSLSAGMRFVLAHPIRVAALEGSALAAQGLALLAYLPIDASLGRGSAAGLLAGLLAAESFLLARLFLREVCRAGQVALYEAAAPAA